MGARKRGREGSTEGRRKFSDVTEAVGASHGEGAEVVEVGAGVAPLAAGD